MALKYHTCILYYSEDVNVSEHLRGGVLKLRRKMPILFECVLRHSEG